MTARTGRCPAPDALDPIEWNGLRRWAEQTVPWVTRGAFGSLRSLESYVEEVLDWGRSNGRLKTSWPATVRNWIRRDEFQRLERLARAGNVGASEALRDPVAWRAAWDSKVQAAALFAPRKEESAPAFPVVVDRPREGFLGRLFGQRPGLGE